MKSERLDQQELHMCNQLADVAGLRALLMLTYIADFAASEKFADLADSIHLVKCACTCVL